MVERSLDQSGQLKRGSHLYERYLSLPARAQLRHSSLHAAQWLNTHLYRRAGQPAIILTSVCAACLRLLLSPQKNSLGHQATAECKNVRSQSFVSFPDWEGGGLTDSTQVGGNTAGQVMASPYATLVSSHMWKVK